MIIHFMTRQYSSSNYISSCLVSSYPFNKSLVLCIYSFTRRLVHCMHLVELISFHKDMRLIICGPKVCSKCSRLNHSVYIYIYIYVYTHTQIYDFTLACSVQFMLCLLYVLNFSFLSVLLCVQFSLFDMCLCIDILLTLINSTCNSTNTINNFTQKGQSITSTSLRTTETVNNT